MAVETFDRDNLVTATKPLITVKTLPLKADESVVRGEALKVDGGKLVALADAAADTVYCVALQTVDAAGADREIVYTYDASLVASELTFAVGTIADYRDGIVANTSLLIEE